MREAVNASLKIMSLYFLIEKIPELMQLLGTYQSIGVPMDEHYAFYAAASLFTVMGICVILFFCSGGIARLIVPLTQDQKFDFKFSKRAVYISSGLVLAALNLPHALSLIFTDYGLRQYGFQGSQEVDNSAYYFVCYSLVTLMCGLLIKKGISCEE
jgi:hypothetical protein